MKNRKCLFSVLLCVGLANAFTLPAGKNTNNDDDDAAPILARGNPAHTLSSHQTNPDQRPPQSRQGQQSARFFFGSFTPGPVNTCSNVLCRSFVANRYRTADGTCNNLRHPSRGRANEPFLRLLSPRQPPHGFGCGAAAGLPNPRELSRIAVRRGERGALDPPLSLMTMVFGQIVDHDLEMTPSASTPSGDFLDCCSPANAHSADCCPVRAAPADHFYGVGARPTCLPVLRSKRATGCDGFRRPDVVNENTPWIDASFLYGSSAARERDLRGARGSLKTSVDRRGRHFPPVSFNRAPGGRGIVSSGELSMQFGDTRGDVTPGSTLLSTAFLRNHNRLAAALAASHPTWPDDTVYREARKINAAVYQHIVYTQFLDALLGEVNDVTVKKNEGFDDRYDESTDPAISVAFGTAGYRLHTLISGHFDLRDARFR